MSRDNTLHPDYRIAAQSRRWTTATTLTKASVHVYPNADLRTHDTEDDDGKCWCNPDMRVGLPNGVPLYVHKSADGRELVERHGAQ